MYNNNNNNTGQPVDKSAETAWQPGLTVQSPATPPIKQESTAQQLRPLTKKRKAFTRELGTNPSSTITSAAIKAGYSPKTAYSIGSELLKKPEVRLELAKYSDTAKMYLLDVMQESKQRMVSASDRDGSAWANVLERTANSVIDRVDGKAQANINVTQQSVNINIDLTGVA